jgi:GTPase SAR1 family protein
MAFSDIIVGLPGTGKTTFLQSEVKNMVENGNRALVVTMQRDDWTEYPIINKYNELESFTGIRRFFYKAGRLERIQQLYKNGILILDDCRMYLHSQRNSFIDWLLISRRHEGIDLFAVFHDLDEIPPVFYRYMTNLVLFHTIGQPEYSKNRIDKNRVAMILEERKKLELEVKQGNQYAKRLINFDIRY